VNRPNLTPPAGVLFDFDGVVVDSLTAHLNAWQFAYKKIFGETLISTEGLAGRSTSAIARILAEMAGQPNRAPELIIDKKSHLSGSAMAIQAMPGIPDAFNLLIKRKIPFGIASNAPRQFIEQTLTRLGIEHPVIVGVDDVLNPKPEPDVFLKCANLIGISFLDHQRTIVFEDSTHGLHAAVKAGMHPIGVETQHPRDILTANGAIKTCVHILNAMEEGYFFEI
jgi:HAD superfamily hydrolase (TIGR01509 family)